MEYKYNMYGVDSGNQHKTISKWYNKAFLRISELSLLHELTTWNISIGDLRDR